jgi:phosphopentomutase
MIIVVLDSLGVGELPDAKAFGDSGANTLKHTLERSGKLKLPNLESLGLLELVSQSTSPSTRGFYSRMKEISHGKDTTTGHWEMMGLPLKQPLSHFEKGFPPEIMREWERLTGCSYLGNVPASGTAIIEQLGGEHLRTLKPIVYTSADSVFQIAAHEEKFGLERLYQICEETRRLLDQSPYKVGRVIARPFVGEEGSFKRTGNRKDFSLMPPQKTVLDALNEKGISVCGVGKIPSIFGYQGITKILEAHNDQEALEATLTALRSEPQEGVIFTNLNDLDMVFGHRRDVAGYGKQLEIIDAFLPKILAELKDDDLLILTADHGNDPTFKGTDHTREFVPLVLYSPRFEKISTSQRRLKDRETFSDLGQTVADNFNVHGPSHGQSFLSEIAS